MDGYYDESVELDVSTAEKITGSNYPQVVNIPDLKKIKENLYVDVGESENILIQYWLFFHGWRTCHRIFSKPTKLKRIIKYKYKFESMACRIICIRPDGTFYAPMHGRAYQHNLYIGVKELIRIFRKGYIYVEGRR